MTSNLGLATLLFLVHNLEAPFWLSGFWLRLNNIGNRNWLGLAGSGGALRPCSGIRLALADEVSRITSPIQRGAVRIDHLSNELRGR